MLTFDDDTTSMFVIGDDRMTTFDDDAVAMFGVDAASAFGFIAMFCVIIPTTLSVDRWLAVTLAVDISMVVVNS